MSNQLAIEAQKVGGYEAQTGKGKVKKRTR